jgi:hypothetical protein
MTTAEYTLYGGLPPHENTATSTLAAIEIKPHAASLRDRVYAWIRQQGMQGATSDEVEAALGMIHQTASARVRELVKLGQLRKSGNTRKTRSGRHAEVLVATELRQ